MYRLHLYLTEDLKNILDVETKITGKSKAEIARRALKKGLKKSQKRSNSAKALLEIAREAESLPSAEPKVIKNLSASHDLYAWGEESNE